MTKASTNNLANCPILKTYSSSINSSIKFDIMNINFTKHYFII